MNANVKVTPGAVGLPEVVTGRPTVAPNTGARLNHKNLRGFQAVEGTAVPDWARLPRPSTRCQYSGLSRTTLLELIDRGAFRAVTIRQPGATRGIRLFHLPGLFAYLARLDVEQNGAGTTPSPEANV